MINAIAVEDIHEKRQKLQREYRENLREPLDIDDLFNLIYDSILCRPGLKPGDSGFVTLRWYEYTRLFLWVDEMRQNPRHPDAHLINGWQPEEIAEITDEPQVVGRLLGATIRVVLS